MQRLRLSTAAACVCAIFRVAQDAQPLRAIKRVLFTEVRGGALVISLAGDGAVTCRGGQRGEQAALRTDEQVLGAVAPKLGALLLADAHAGITIDAGGARIIDAPLALGVILAGALAALARIERAQAGAIICRQARLPSIEQIAPGHRREALILRVRQVIWMRQAQHMPELVGQRAWQVYAK